MTLRKMVEMNSQSDTNTSTQQMERMGSMSETDDFKLRHKTIAKIQALESQRLNQEHVAANWSQMPTQSPSWQKSNNSLNKFVALPPIGHTLTVTENKDARTKSGGTVRSHESLSHEGKSKTHPNLYQRNRPNSGQVKLTAIEVYIRKKVAATLLQASVKAWFTRQKYYNKRPEANHHDQIKPSVSRQSPAPSKSSRKRPYSAKKRNDVATTFVVDNQSDRNGSADKQKQEMKVSKQEKTIDKVDAKSDKQDKKTDKQDPETHRQEARAHTQGTKPKGIKDLKQERKADQQETNAHKQNLAADKLDKNNDQEEKKNKKHQQEKKESQQQMEINELHESEEDRSSPISNASKSSKKTSRSKASKDTAHSAKEEMTEMIRHRTASVKLEAEKRKLIAERIRLQKEASEAKDAKQATASVKKNAEVKRKTPYRPLQNKSPERLSPLLSSRMNTQTGDENSSARTESKVSSSLPVNNTKSFTQPVMQRSPRMPLASTLLRNVSNADSSLNKTEQEKIDSNHEETEQSSAAVVIQKQFRGYRARSSLVNKQRASKELDDEYKDWKTRRIDAAVAIQSAWRGYSVRKDMQDEVEDSMQSFESQPETFELPELIVINIGRSKSEIERANRKFSNSSMLQMTFRAANLRRKLLIRAAVRRNVRNKAATKIQALYRGYLTRSGTKLAAAATNIQLVCKGFLARLTNEERKVIRKLEQREAATMLQSAYQSFMRRRLNEAEKEERRRNNAAVDIQSALRAFLVRFGLQRRQEELQSDAAKKIQQMVRGRRNRLEMKRMQEDAETIVAGFRSYKARQVVKALIEKHERERIAATRIQAAYKAYLIRNMTQEYKEKMARENKAATKIQHSLKGMRARQKYKKDVELKRKNAALNIQRYYRGYVGRMIAKARRRVKATVVIQKFYRGYVGRKIATSVRREKAALTIQRVYRGHLGRKTAKSARREEAALKIQKVYRGHRGRLVANDKRMEKKAALDIQRMYRGHLGRKIAKMARNKHMEKKAALDIQRMYRGHLGRKIAKMARNKHKQKKAALDIQRVYRGHQGRKIARGFRREKAALDIQRVYRGYRGREVVRKEREKRENKEMAADLVALVVHKALLFISKRSKSAERIQAVVKGYFTRFDIQSKLAVESKEKQAKRKVSANVIQCVFRAKHVRKVQERQRVEQERNMAAVKIQSVWKGSRTRKDIEKEREMIANIEPPPTALISARSQSGKLLSISLDQVLIKNNRAIIVFHRKATELQAAFRAKKVREEMVERRVRKTEIALKTPRKAKSQRQVSREEKAAVFVQKTFRGYFDRKVYKNAKKYRHKVQNHYADYIQASVRGYNVRQLEHKKQEAFGGNEQGERFIARYRSANMIATAFRGYRFRKRQRAQRVEM